MARDLADQSGRAGADVRVRARGPETRYELEHGAAVARLVRSHGIAGRVNTLAVIVEQIRVHPLRGSGTGILDALVAGRQQAFAGRLGPNLFLTTWMETGVAGALLLVWLFGLVLWRVGRAARRSDTLGALAQGLFAGVIALVVQSQFNNSFLLGFFWVQLGLCAAAVVIHERGGGTL